MPGTEKSEPNSDKDSQEQLWDEKKVIMRLLYPFISLYVVQDCCEEILSVQKGASE